MIFLDDTQTESLAALVLISYRLEKDRRGVVRARRNINVKLLRWRLATFRFFGSLRSSTRRSRKGGR